MTWGAGAWGTRAFGATSPPTVPGEIPPATPGTTIRELRRLWGRDVFFKNGDYSVGPAGDWLVVDREEALRQAIIRRVITDPGEWTTLPEYGIGARAFVKARKTRAVISELRERIRTQLLREPRIASVEQVDIESDISTLKISIKVLAKGRAERSEPLVISVEVS